MTFEFRVNASLHGNQVCFQFGEQPSKLSLCGQLAPATSQALSHHLGLQQMALGWQVGGQEEIRKHAFPQLLFAV